MFKPHPHLPSLEDQPSLHPSYLEAKTSYIRQDLDATIRILGPKLTQVVHFPPAALLLGKAYFFLSRAQEAEEAWTGSLKNYPDHLETQKWLIRLYLEQGREKEAEELCKKALFLDSENPELLLLYGKIRLLQKDILGALEAFEKAKATWIKLVEVPLELAAVYRRFGLAQRCQTELELALSILGPNHSLYPSIRFNLENLKKQLQQNTQGR
ncbi:MAG: tetratricopeptide repeat protein [Spirochaetales bacterium]